MRKQVNGVRHYLELLGEDFALMEERENLI